MKYHRNREVDSEVDFQVNFKAEWQVGEMVLDYFDVESAFKRKSE